MDAFVADSILVAAVVPSPNCEARTMPLDMLVLHYTGMADAAAALAKLTSAEGKVSTHYVVLEDGRIVQCVPEALRAWHAGASEWEGMGDVNSRSIGIEIANPGHGLGYPAFPEVQVAAVIALCRDILARHPIRPVRVVAHSDIAPGRKKDPGEKFPWAELAAAGVGHWVAPVAPGEPVGLSLGDIGAAVLGLQRAFAAYGYPVPQNGVFDEPTRHVVIAFQRHFRPDRVDGIADESTRATLRKLLAAVPIEA